MNEYGSDYLFVGGLREDYCITQDGEVFEGILGGNAAYAAAGAHIWSDSTAIISRVGSNYPPSWLEDLSGCGINIDGVRVLQQEQDHRTFYAYLSENTRVDRNPAAHYLRIGRPLPKALVGYETSTPAQDEREHFDTLSIRSEDLPDWVQNVRAAHLSPAHYLTHCTLPVRLRELGVRMVTLDPALPYMDPRFRKELPILLHGISAFLPSEMEARAFFHPAILDVWEMAEAFSSMGCPLVVIKSGKIGQYLWESQSGSRWHIPPYPVHTRDVTGAGDAYCGGFLVGYDRTQDPVEAALYGSVSASMTIEGVGPLHALDAHPTLAQYRLTALRAQVRTQ